jgi:hypothetical protein
MPSYRRNEMVPTLGNRGVNAGFGRFGSVMYDAYAKRGSSPSCCHITNQYNTVLEHKLLDNQKLRPCFAYCKAFIYLFLYLLFICAYNVWVISPPFPLTTSLSPALPATSLPGRNYFALISNFVEERV